MDGLDLWAAVMWDLAGIRFRVFPAAQLMSKSTGN